MDKNHNGRIIQKNYELSSKYETKTASSTSFKMLSATPCGNCSETSIVNVCLFRAHDAGMGVRYLMQCNNCNNTAVGYSQIANEEHCQIVWKTSNSIDTFIEYHQKRIEHFKQSIADFLSKNEERIEWHKSMVQKLKQQKGSV